MSADKAFVDSNVLIYARDIDAGERHEIAARLVAELWESRRAVISTQVLQEFYVNVTRKIPSPLPRSVGRQMIRTYAAWQTESIGEADIRLASEIEEQHIMSFWDALIIAAAIKGGAATLLTEDMNAGSTIAGVRIDNPFPARA